MRVRPERRSWWWTTGRRRSVTPAAGRELRGAREEGGWIRSGTPPTGPTWTGCVSATTCGADAGAARELLGAHDPADPADRRPVVLDGTVYFAWESPTWGGGIAFYDPDTGGTSLGLAYLVSAAQFADVATQEMHRDPSGDRLDLATLVAAGRLVLGPGRYETLHVVGEIDSVAVVTFTSSVHDEMPLSPPGPAYLATMARGLADAHGLSVDETADYLLSRPGCMPHWTREDLRDVVATAVAG